MNIENAREFPASRLPDSYKYMTDEEFTRCTNHYCRDCRAVLDAPTIDLRCDYHNKLWDANAKKQLVTNYKPNICESFGVSGEIFDYEQYEFDSAYGFDHEAYAPGHGSL